MSDDPKPRCRVVLTEQGDPVDLQSGKIDGGETISQHRHHTVAPLGGQRVLVQGTAVYKPSGRLLRIDALLVEPNAEDSTLWSVIPPPRKRKIDIRQILKPQGPTSGVSAFFGTWPGMSIPS